MFNKKRLIQVDINKKESNKKGSCSIKVGFPTNMPEEEVKDIKKRINDIIDDIRKYL